jgi:hypothetical protein
MVEEVIQIIDDIEGECTKDSEFTDENRQRVAMYMSIVKESMENQHKIIISYETITRNLEKQINEC